MIFECCGRITVVVGTPDHDVHCKVCSKILNDSEAIGSRPVVKEKDPETSWKDDAEEQLYDDIWTFGQTGVEKTYLYDEIGISVRDACSMDEGIDVKRQKYDPRERLSMTPKSFYLYKPKICVQCKNTYVPDYNRQTICNKCRPSLVGNKFGNWTVLKRLDMDDVREKNLTQVRATWRCRCDCGKIKDVYEYSLLHGKSKSCGCTRGRKTKKEEG